MQEAQVWSMGWEEVLEEEIATCSSILAWRIPWTVDPTSLLGHKDLTAEQQHALSYVLLSLLFGPSQGVSQFVKHIHAQGHIVVCCQFHQDCGFSAWEAPF